MFIVGREWCHVIRSEHPTAVSGINTSLPEVLPANTGKASYRGQYLVPESLSIVCRPRYLPLGRGPRRAEAGLSTTPAMWWCHRLRRSKHMCSCKMDRVHSIIHPKVSKAATSLLSPLLVLKPRRCTLLAVLTPLSRYTCIPCSEYG